MKLLKIAAAAALVALALPSSAKIATDLEDGNELVLTVWSASAQASYLQDLGLTLGAFKTAGMAETGYSFSTAVTSVLTSQTALATATDLRWAVTTFDTQGDYQPGQTRLLITFNPASAGLTDVGPGSNTTQAPPVSAANLQQAQATWADYISKNNALPTHTTLANGSSYASSSVNAAAYLLADGNPKGNMQDALSFESGNAKGATSNFWYFTGSDSDFADPQATSLLFKNSQATGSWSFDGTTVSYSLAAAAPVPEAESYALMLAGLAGLGLMARRRRARD